MKRYLHLLLVSLSLTIVFYSCTNNEPLVVDEAEILHRNQDLLTQIIIYDVFTPPVASRIYVYSSLASYEAIRHSQSNAPSIAAKLNGFAPMPEPEPGKKYNFTLAATKAFFSVVRKVKVFSVDSLNKYEQDTYKQFGQIADKETYDRSIAFGDSVAAVVLARAGKDGYAASRGKAKHLGSNEAGKWRPTPPDYMDGVEWCWNTMKPMVLDSASQFMPVRPPAYSKDSNSLFYKYVKEVFAIKNNITEEQKTIAKYWDDNPFVIEHAGHMSFGNKKITPGGHWMGIAAIAARQSKADLVKIAQTYCLTAVALFDGFISCWDEKYRSNVVRPVSVINEWFDPAWSPFLQTPPFPEYTSGHSTITASAAVVLEALYGTNYSFQDTSDLRYIGMQRHFNSFREAAAEASISRVYGGIHYRSGVEAGAEQGTKVGSLIVKKVMDRSEAMK